MSLSSTFLVAYILFSFALPNLVRADDEAKYKAQLEAIRKQVNAIQKSISARQARRGAELGELKKSELEIASLVKRIRETSGESQQAQASLEALDARAASTNKALSKHRQSLDRQLKTAYQTGRTPRIQLLLNQRDPALISRMLNYYRYFNEARQREIDRSLDLLSELAQIRKEQARASEQLAQAHERLKAQHASMQQARKNRRSTIAALEKRLSSDSAKLSRLRQDQSDLETLLEQLNEVFANIPAPPLEQRPFKTMKGKLPWPALGNLKARFNSRKGTANLRWEGMFIGARRGNNVRAIYHGRVAFADWMNGFGLILILDHGDSYMTIYANNEELRKSQGEWVKPGEIIATVGDSGGQSKTGVYFEIRRNGRPINPHSWVKKSIKSVSIQ